MSGILSLAGAPPSQKLQQIGFWLSAGPGGAGQPQGGGLVGILSDPSRIGGALLNDIGLGNTHLVLSIRPEDITRTEPSRIAVQQTLGGAWVDDFGPGIAQINLSGHTGWRGGLLSSGQDEFFNLRDTVFAKWHARRAAAVKNGKDPDADTSLYFSDSLDNISVRCAPRSFTMHRSRTRPLLYIYQISLVVLDDAASPDSLLDSIATAVSNPLRFLAGIAGLGNVVSLLGTALKAIQGVINFVNTAIAIGQVAISQVIGIGAGIMNSVNSVIAALNGNVSGPAVPLLGTAASYCGAMSNAFYALASDNTLPSNLRIPIAQCAAAFNDANCTIRNSFGNFRIYSSYDALYGASACSSTAGGRPWSTYTAAGTSGIADIFVPQAPLISVTPPAAGALALLNSDPLLMVGQQTQVLALMQTAASGVKLP